MGEPGEAHLVMACSLELEVAPWALWEAPRLAVPQLVPQQELVWVLAPWVVVQPARVPEVVAVPMELTA